MNTVDAQEIQNFSKDSSHWWDIQGPFKPLHRLNPVRLKYIKQQICAHYSLNFEDLKPYKDLKILDVGCGGGLVCEPMARLSGTVTGIDADKNAIAVATDHAQESGLDITYKATTSDALVKEGAQFDVVLALEIIEHVSDPETFIKSILDLCKPGGLVIFSTLNRTSKSFALGIVAAEYILRWVPHGTHNWKKFIKPSELSRYIRQHGGSPRDICGMTFDPLRGEFNLAPNDVDVNYFLSVAKAK